MCDFLNATQKASSKPGLKDFIKLSNIQVLVWSIMGIQSPNDICYIYIYFSSDLFCESHSIRSNWWYDTIHCQYNFK